jgi:Fe-S cluster biogenesis protein NfuA
MTDDLRAKVKKVLDEQIRPRLQGDGGDVELVEITDDGVVKVRLTGACAGCMFSAMTQAVVVEKTLKDNIPEITRVEPAA